MKGQDRCSGGVKGWSWDKSFSPVLTGKRPEFQRIRKSRSKRSIVIEQDEYIRGF
jgi:hypothetical protein